ncbi:MAG: MASE1 domain-containing protein [Deltaproteobacteria bacterium]|nr:MASE1 domain-containing protein [Deltaproteobacteria bacterium]
MKNSPFLKSSVVYLLKTGVLGGLYLATAKMGLMLDAVSGFATVVWPPTGIALAGLLLFGYRLWPSIAIAAFLANIDAGASLSIACGIAMGNTLEAVIGTWLLRRLSGFKNSFDRLRDVIAFIFLAALLATTISATIGVSTLYLAKIVSATSFDHAWSAWWVGDMLGALVMAPVFLAWGRGISFRKIRFWRVVEAVVLCLTLLFICLWIFSEFFAGRIKASPVSYMMFIPMIWAAVRFGPRGSALAVFAVSVLAVWGTVRGFGPFTQKTLAESLFFLQTFMGIAAVTSLMLAAAAGERLALTDTLRQSEERFRALVESSPAGILAVNDRGEIDFFNTAAEKMFGYWRGEVIGKKVECLLSKALHEAHIRQRAGFFAKPEMRQMGAGRDLNALHKNRSEFPVEIGLSPVKTREGIQVVAFITDITIRKKTEEDLKKINEELQRLNENRALFTSIVSHELRTPLQSIKEGIDIVLDGIDGPVTSRQKETLGISKSNVDRLARLIDNVLDYSKLEAGKMKMEFEKTDLNRLVEEVYRLMKLEVGRKGLDFFIELPAGPVFAVVDDDKIRQVLINLVHNAVKFTDKGKISVRLGQIRHAVSLEVEDTGSGIRREDQATIFDMYDQGPDAQAFKIGGSGIGLTVCKLIVDQHGGQIRLESSPGKGSKFTITLPQRT